MNPVAIGELVGAFAVMIGVAAVWLIVCYAIPPLRRRPRVAYIVAMILATSMALVMNLTGTWVGAAILCVALLYWPLRRAERRQLVARQLARLGTPMKSKS